MPQAPALAAEVVGKLLTGALRDPVTSAYPGNPEGCCNVSAARKPQVRQNFRHKTAGAIAHSRFNTSQYTLKTAERVGFEPTVPWKGTTVFETASLNRSDTSPQRTASRMTVPYLT